MKLPSLTPSLLYPGQQAKPLVQLPKIHSRFDERFLQDLLAANPELLPLDAIRKDVGPLQCVGREVGVPSGCIDNLYISASGCPVLVETKLWRNPQARREVLSQTLEYVKDLVKMDFEWFEQQWKTFRESTPHNEFSLAEQISNLAQDEISEGVFVDRVNHALMRGDILALIVGDGIETRLQELVSDLCKKSSHLRYALALCELSFFQLGSKESDGMIVVPRVVNNVEPVQRAYVRVELADELQKKLVVTPVEVEVEEATGPLRINLNEEEFLRSVECSVGAEIRHKFQDAYNELIESFGLEPDWKAASLVLKIPDPNGEKPAAGLFVFEVHGRVYNPIFMKGRMERWGLLSEEEVERITSTYWAMLNTIDSRFSPKGILHVAPGKFIPFSDLLSKWPAIKDAIGKAVGAVQDAIENASKRVG